MENFELKEEEIWLLQELDKHPNANQNLLKLFEKSQFKFSVSSVETIFRTFNDQGLIKGMDYGSARISVAGREFLKNRTRSQKNQGVTEKKEYSEDQLLFLWALEKVNKLDFVNDSPSMYRVSDILMELKNESFVSTGKRWLQELIDDSLIVGSVASPMIAGVREEGVQFIQNNSHLFQDFDKQNSVFIRKLKDPEFLGKLAQTNNRREKVDRIIKHAFSTEKEHFSFLATEYSNQGLIGYLSTSEIKRSKKLSNVYLEDSPDQMISVDLEKEDFEKRRIGQTVDLGYTSPDPTALKLYRFFFKGETLTDHDHFVATNPSIENLKKYGYRDETVNQFGDIYLFEEPGENRQPLYVWSTHPDILFFKPLSEPSPKTDKTAFLWSDGAAEEDELGRESLVSSVTDSINDLFEKGYKDAYTVLLNGEWGSGKSSMLNFFEKHLGKKEWNVIRYNAWENQQFKDPWWIMINAISKKATDENYKGDFASHRRWKLGIQYRNKIWALVLIVIFIGSASYLFNSSLTNGKLTVSTISGIVALIGSLVSAIVGLTNNFFYKAVSNEDLKERFTGHPFEPIRQRFKEIVNGNKLAIFIDDMDRCDVEATVTLLEGIQNLFKTMPVLYIIAADGQWVSHCFNQKYDKFQELTNDGCSIGDKFLQKTFQLTLNVPKPAEEDRKAYWDKLIGQSPLDKPEEQNGETSAPGQPKLSKEQFAAQYEEKLQQRNATRAQKLKDVKEEIEENIEHYLRQFLDMGVPDNPRQMKRFINQYEVARQTLVVEGLDEEYQNDDKLVNYLIFNMTFPSLVDKIKKGELTKYEILATGGQEAITLTNQDRELIKKLLADIEDDLIKGDFYSI